MVKEIDVGVSQMGAEILTNKGSDKNPTKSVEIQKAPEKPYTIDDHSKMFEAIGKPEEATKLKQQAINALTEEGKNMNDNVIKIDKKIKNEKGRIPVLEDDNMTDEEKAEKKKKTAKDRAEFFKKDKIIRDREALELESKSTGLDIAMRPKAAVHIMKVQWPLDVIEEFNTHIYDVIIPKNVDAAGGLVGQINRNEKSAQLKIDHVDDDVGKQFSDILLKLGKTYMYNVTGIESEVSMETMWSVHSYEGDYNPVHDHGTRTPMGLSCILYLKVPPQIQKLGNPAEEFEGLNNSSGAVDGFTYLSWGANGMRDINMLRPITEEYIKPEVGTMLMFPSWLRHGVMPFFGEGERRTFSANMNVTPKTKISGDHYRKHTPESDLVKSINNA